MQQDWPMPQVQGNIKRWPEIGLTLIEKFVSEEEEGEILRSIRSDDKWSNQVAKRQSVSTSASFAR